MKCLLGEISTLKSNHYGSQNKTILNCFCIIDGELKLFAAVPKEVFITFIGVMLGLLLLTIALLGHLLGFHIYLSKFNFCRCLKSF